MPMVVMDQVVFDESEYMWGNAMEAVRIVVARVVMTVMLMVVLMEV